MLIVKIIAIIAGWLLFYNVLKARKKRLAGTKASIITILFGALILQFSDNVSAWVDQTFSHTHTTSETTVTKTHSESK